MIEKLKAALTKMRANIERHRRELGPIEHLCANERMQTLLVVLGMIADLEQEAREADAKEA